MSVLGERGTATVARALSLQARVSNWLATGVLLLVGCGLTVWYYAHQLGRGARAQQQAAPARQAIAAEMSLPPLGPIERPAPPPPEPFSGAVIAPTTAAGTGSEAGGSAPASSAAQLPVVAAAPLLMNSASRTQAGPPLLPAMAGARAVTSRDRRLSAQVYVAAASASSGNPTTVTPQVSQGVAAAPFAPTTPGQGPAGAAEAGAGASVPAAMSGAVRDAGLSAPMAVPVVARLLGPQSLILPKGTSIDCTLETAIDSTLPGLTRCLTATDTFGADGHVVLLERGTELVGETQGQVQQGAARVFVLWSEARTPRGIIVPLESPGADELGRAGLPGTVQRHFWERFGAAILVSTIDGAVEAAVQSSSHDNGTVIYSPGASQDVMTEVLRSTVAIPPTVRKANGDRIQVLVARDVDFGDVYELRAAGDSR